MLWIRWLAPNNSSEDATMTIMKINRKILFFTGLALLPLSVVLEARFAGDFTAQVPEPTSLSLFALGGVAMVVVSLIRRSK